MSKNILVLNTGSSSIKYRLFGVEETLTLKTTGLVEYLEAFDSEKSMASYRDALTQIMGSLEGEGYFGPEGPDAIGHRVVHGGSYFSQAVLIDDLVLEGIKASTPLAPLHNPSNQLGIELCREHWPHVPQVAVFDTAFHQTMPESSYRYAIPDAYYADYKVRRYGFHGTSYMSVMRCVGRYLGVPATDLNLIVFHLGNGASACAIKSGKSFNTSMGMTPLSGLIMGTRSGDFDPGVLVYLVEQCGLDLKDLDDALNRESGLKALAGHSDMRELLSMEAQGVSKAGFAVSLFIQRIREYLGAYFVTLKHIDAVVFTGGIGEHAASIRQRVMEDLDHIGLVLDIEKNNRDQAFVREVQSPASQYKIMVVPTDEEGEIALQTADLVFHVSSCPPAH
jgi:acetate kinase